MANIPVIAEINNLLDADTTAIAKTALGVLGAATKGDIVAADIANDAVTTAKILNLNVTSGKLAVGAAVANIVDDTLPVAKVTGTLPVAKGGTGAATLTSGSVLVGAGTSTPTFVAPSTAGNVLTSVSGVWTSAPATGGTPTNAQVNTAITTDAPASRAALVIPPRNEYLRNTLRELSANKNAGKQLQLRILMLGDSWLAQTNLQNNFRAAFGHLGQILQAGTATLASGATVATQLTRYAAGSYSGNSVTLPAGGTATFIGVATSTNNFDPATQLVVCYRKTVGGGTFQPKIRKSDGTFASVNSGFTIPAIDTNVATTPEEGVFWYSLDFSQFVDFAATSTQLQLVGVSGNSEIIAAGLVNSFSGTTQIRPSTYNRHGVIHYSPAVNSSAAGLWDTIPQQSWNTLMDFMAPQIVFLRDWRETGVNIDTWINYFSSVITKIQTGRKALITASMIYGATGNTVTLTAVAAGIGGESIRCKFLNNGNSQSLTTTVSGNDITVNLATNGSGNITSTPSLIAASINAAASGLVTATYSGSAAFTLQVSFIPLSTNVGVDFVLIGSNPVGDDIRDESILSDEKMRQFCATNRIMFVDARAAFPLLYGDCVKEGFSSVDGLHLTTAGDLLLQKTVFESLQLKEALQEYNSQYQSQYPRFHGGSGVQGDWFSFYNSASTVLPSIGFRRTDSGIQNTGDHYKITAKASDNTFISAGAKEFIGTNVLRQIDIGARQSIGFTNDMTRLINGRVELGTGATNVIPLVVGAIAAQTVPILSIRTGTSSSADGTEVSGFDKQGIPFLPQFTTTNRNALSFATGSIVAGSIIFNTTTSKLNFYNGTAWEAVTSS